MFKLKQMKINVFPKEASLLQDPTILHPTFLLKQMKINVFPKKALLQDPTILYSTFLLKQMKINVFPKEASLLQGPTILYPTFLLEPMKINVFPKKAPLLPDSLKRLKLTYQSLSCLINYFFLRLQLTSVLTSLVVVFKTKGLWR